MEEPMSQPLNTGASQKKRTKLVFVALLVLIILGGLFYYFKKVRVSGPSGSEAATQAPIVIPVEAQLPIIITNP